MARPTKCTNGTKAKIFAALEAGCTRASAAAAGGVHYDTLREWMLADPELEREVQIAEEAAVGAFESVIAKAREENWTAAAWWLERRRSKEYARKDQLTLRKLEQLDDEALIEFIAGDAAETPEGETASDLDS